jgi:hypothetical protein
MAIWKPTFTPKLKTGTYKKGIRVERWQPDRPRDGFQLPNFGMGWERAGAHGGVRPQRLEVRKGEREYEAGNDDAFDEVRELNERAEAGATAGNISQLRKHLARRKGQKFEPTGSVSNSPYDLKGGNLGVPSWGVTQRGRRSKRELLREAKKRAKIRQSAGPKGGMR